MTGLDLLLKACESQKQTTTNPTTATAPQCVQSAKPAEPAEPAIRARAADRAQAHCVVPQIAECLTKTKTTPDGKLSVLSAGNQLHFRIKRNNSPHPHPHSNLPPSLTSSLLSGTTLKKGIHIPPRKILYDKNDIYGDAEAFASLFPPPPPPPPPHPPHPPHPPPPHISQFVHVERKKKGKKRKKDTSATKESPQPHLKKTCVRVSHVSQTVASSSSSSSSASSSSADDNSDIQLRLHSYITKALKHQENVAKQLNDHAIFMKSLPISTSMNKSRSLMNKALLLQIKQLETRDAELERLAKQLQEEWNLSFSNKILL